ncbi:MAG: hypothetical protein NTV23_03245 [Propionibacteriales bacterium]|nr:hypothetical protein [Propionibacteriales bacterium]
MFTVQINADLRFSVALPDQPELSGTITGSGDRLVVRLSDPARFAGGRDSGQVKNVAAMLASRGLKVVVMADDDVLLEIGDTHAPWWQRGITRSRHLRIVSLRGAITGASGRLRRSDAAVIPGRELVPPQTLFPIAPTFRRNLRPVTTTHDSRRGGNPRLVLRATNPGLPEGGALVYPLRSDTVTIGSDDGCDIRLAGLDPVHAVVVHDERDEFVLHDRSGDGSTTVNGVSAQGRVLRTGARVNVGPWTLAYRRAEYADHGRPFGGRVGGELGRQRSQPDPRGATPTTPTDPEVTR